jgi:hypothetical protein
MDDTRSFAGSILLEVSLDGGRTWRDVLRLREIPPRLILDQMPGWLYRWRDETTNSICPF